MSAPIFRPINVDDDGTGTTGTVVTAAYMTALYDDIDRASNSIQLSTVVGTQHNFALGLNADAILRWNGVSAVTFTGFTNPVVGRSLIIWNVTAAQALRVAHEDAGSTAANRVLGLSVRGQTIGPGGWMVLIYDSTSLRWRIGPVSPGAPITPVFDANHFTGSGSLTWGVAVGNVQTMTFLQDGKQVEVNANIHTTTVSGAGTDLQISNGQWGGFTASKLASQVSRILDNNVAAPGRTVIGATGTQIITRSSLAVSPVNWAASTAQTSVEFVFKFEVD